MEMVKHQDFCSGCEIRLLYENISQKKSKMHRKMKMTEQRHNWVRLEKLNDNRNNVVENSRTAMRSIYLPSAALQSRILKSSSVWHTNKYLVF